MCSSISSVLPVLVCFTNKQTKTLHLDHIPSGLLRGCPLQWLHTPAACLGQGVGPVQWRIKENSGPKAEKKQI